MAAYSNYALRVPAYLIEDLRTAAEQDGVSMNGLIIQAVAEKVASLRAGGLLRGLAEADQMTYLDSRAARAPAGQLAELIGRAGITNDVLPGDEIPDGWLAGESRST